MAEAVFDRGRGLLGEKGELLWAEAPDLGVDQQNVRDLNTLLARHSVLATVAERVRCLMHRPLTPRKGNGLAQKRLIELPGFSAVSPSSF
jgi:hypothetical protein